MSDAPSAGDASTLLGDPESQEEYSRKSPTRPSGASNCLYFIFLAKNLNYRFQDPKRKVFLGNSTGRGGRGKARAARAGNRQEESRMKAGGLGVPSPVSLISSCIVPKY